MSVKAKSRAERYQKKVIKSERLKRESKISPVFWGLLTFSFGAKSSEANREGSARHSVW